MKKEQHQIVAEKMAELKGKKLQRVLRAGSMANFGFGDLVQHDFHRTGENQEIIVEKGYVPNLALHAECFFRLSCDDEIVLSRGDIYEPSSKHAQEDNFDRDNFDWTGPYGNNRFEEIASKFFDNQSTDFTVKNVFVSRLGDLKITFSNGFVLEILPDISGDEECWRFFKIGSEDHLIVNGQGIEEEIE